MYIGDKQLNSGPIVPVCVVFHRLMLLPEDTTASHGDIAAVATMGLNRDGRMSSDRCSINHQYQLFVSFPYDSHPGVLCMLHLCMLLCRAIGHLGRKHICLASKSIRKHFSSAAQGCRPDLCTAAEAGSRLRRRMPGSHCWPGPVALFWQRGGPDTVVSTDGPRPFYR